MAGDNKPPRPHVTLRAVSDTETNGNGPVTPRAPRDLREEYERPFHTPKSPAEISANAAVEALAASVEASGWAGQAMEAAARSEKATERNTGEIIGLKMAVETLTEDVAKIARAIGAKRTWSSDGIQIPSVRPAPAVPPAPPPPIRIETSRSQTGEHQVLAPGELERIQREWGEVREQLADSNERARIAEAEARGAAAYAEKLEAEKAKKEEVDAKTALVEKERLEKRSKRLEILRTALVIAITIVSAVGGAVTWAVSHYSAEVPHTFAVPTQGHLP